MFYFTLQLHIVFAWGEVESRPEVVCYEGNCVCPRGYQLWQNGKKCRPLPGALKNNLGIRPSFKATSTIQITFLKIYIFYAQ